MNSKEFVEAILNTDEETFIAVCQLLEADPQLVVFQDLLSGNTHKAHGVRTQSGPEGRPGPR